MNLWVYILINGFIMQCLLFYYLFKSFPIIRMFKIKGASFLTIYVVTLLLSVVLLPVVILMIMGSYVGRLFRKKKVVPVNEIDDLLKGFKGGGV